MFQPFFSFKYNCAPIFQFINTFLFLSLFFFLSFLTSSFGYVVEGADFLRDIKEDDMIVSAKVTDGLDRLVLPKSAE